MKKSIQAPVPVPVPVPETITTQMIWDHIQVNKCNPKPTKNTIDAVFDKIMAVARNMTVEEIAIALARGESHFKWCKLEPLGLRCLENVYDQLNDCKIGLFPGLKISAGTKYDEIADIYYLHKFVALYGLPPYEEGKINLPEGVAVKKPRVKLPHNCPNCGHSLTG